MFLEQQISILERFLKDHVMLKTGVMKLKIQLCHPRSILHFKMQYNRKWLLIIIILYSFYCIFD